MALVPPAASAASAAIANPWRNCGYCPDKVFKTSSEFTRHLRDHHCSREGGSFVCHYGYNGVCSSLPVEGVSDKDYEDHVLRHHTKSCNPENKETTREPSGGISPSPLQGHLYRLSLLSDGPSWNVNAACQNMAAILNDPKKGKQKDFFTRTWGEGFVEKTEIPPSDLLPEVTEAHFSLYLKKIAKRDRKTSPKKTSLSNEVSLQFPNLRAAKSMEKNQADVDSIPKTFLQPNFDLSRRETFYEVFPFVAGTEVNEGAPAGGCRQVLQSGKLLQEKLSHHLDVIEMQIAHQIAHKSDAFFQAVASHDTVREEIGRALTAVQALRLKVKNIDATVAQDSLKVLQCVVARRNYAAVHRKLKLMATVHQTQPTIQLLLSTSDFVGALDLIGTTQEVVHQELMSVHCFRYLSSQLAEMENLIEKMLSTEFERLTTAELNRPLSTAPSDDPATQPLITEEDRLTAVLYGMLRQRRYNFIELFKDEALTTMKALMKQAMIEALAANDAADSDSRGPTSLLDQLKHLNFAAWTRLMRQCMNLLIALLRRIRAIHDLMSSVVSAASIRSVESDAPMVTDDDRQRLHQSLREMLQSICDACDEQCGRLLSARTKDGAMLERVSSLEFVALAQLIEQFVGECDQITAHTGRALRMAFQSQATRFVQKFHEERRSKLGSVLDSERWRSAEVPVEVQTAIQRFMQLHESATENSVPGASKEAAVVGGESFVVVGAAIFFLPQMFEYCKCVDDLPTAAPDLLTRLVELLKTFNSRTCQLVLGAGALPLVGLKTITSRNLALASRSLQLIARFIPLLRSHFEERLPSKHKTMVKHFDQALKDYGDHIGEIENKLLSLLSDMVESYLSSWEIKPPVPSQSFRSICKQMAKLHEAVAGIWPSADVQRFYHLVNEAFKRRLRIHIERLGVHNDGGPQHGLVTSELVFYVQNLKSLKVVADDETAEHFSRDLWTAR